MPALIILILIVIACYKWGSVKNWKEYYPTILYYIIADSMYDIAFYNKLLWKFDNHLYSDAFITFIVFPGIIILFLSYLPVKRMRLMIYILSWAIFGTLVEYFALVTGSINYYYGWNIFCSLAFLLIMFIMLAVHFKKPLLAWPISIGLGWLMLLIFNVPISSINQ